jgi:hypothetical protein
MFQLLSCTLSHHHQFAVHRGFTIYILILYMIRMSQKMTSQTITDEFIYVSVQGNERNT